jgi:membrane-associated protease RseP (regulator of RpoE activity)
MTRTSFRFLGLLLGFGFSVFPTMLLAQHGSRAMALYAEEPWGSSYLGVDTQDITPERLGQLHLKEERGVEVTVVDQDAPAGKAGIKEHDVILSINDQQVQSVEQLRRLIREIPPGRTITIGISRGGQPFTLKAQLAERQTPRNEDFNFSPAIRIPPVPPVHVPSITIPDIDVPSIIVVMHSPRNSGLLVENITPQLGEYFGVKGGSGVLVRSVDKGSRAEQAGFRAGDVIIKINGSTVNDSSDFTRLLRSRTTDKASVTVIRDRKEQNLSLSLPPRRSGSLTRDRDCRNSGPGACPELPDDRTALDGLSAQLHHLEPELERMGKEFREQAEQQSHQLQKELEKFHSEWQQQKQEFERDMREWLKKPAI